MKPSPLLVDYISAPIPSIDGQEPLASALAFFEKNGPNEVAVMEEGRLVGLLTARDLRLVLNLEGVDAHQIRVGSVAQSDFHLVRPEARLDQVVSTMIREKIEQTLVVSGHRVLGLFTSADALRAVKTLLNSAE